MSLNKFMHPRNIYKKKKPNFQALAVKFPEFRRHASQESNGKVTINFKDPDALRALSTALLKEDFGLDVHIPADRLVPTIPLRLNYIHWIEDILKTTWNDKVQGIDIGTGASCIYPLLGSRMNGWKFLASEQDEESVASARKNVEQNGLHHLIDVRKVEKDSGLKELLEGNNTTYDFCMCNPPFFGSQEEADGQFDGDGRSEPHAAPTANATESITWGGEFCFVNRLIEDSLQLKDNVRVYTSMIGKKLNMAALKDELRNHKVPNICSTEFCQGKTMRWGLAWSFDPNITFPKSHFKEKKKKARPPVALCIPIEIAVEFKTFCHYIVELLEELKITFVEVKQNNWIFIAALLVTENNWSHQRRKRRQKLRENVQSGSTEENLDTAASMEKSPSKSLASSGRNPVETSVLDSAQGGLDKPNEKSIEENQDTRATGSQLEKSNLDSNVSRSDKNSGEKICLTSENPELVVSDNIESPALSENQSSLSANNEDGNLVSPDKVSPQIQKTLQEPKSPNAKQIALSSRKHKREESDDDLEMRDIENDPKKARIGKTEKMKPDTNSATDLVEVDKSKSNIDLPNSSTGFVDLTTDSASPTETQEHLSQKGITPYLLKCNLTLKRNKTYILLELDSLEGDKRELMHQLLQYFRNKLLP